MTAALIGERLGRYLWISGNSHEALAECRAAVARLSAGRRPRRPCPRARLRGPPAPAARARSRGARALRAGAGDRARRRRAPRGGQHPQHDVRRARATPARWKPGSSTATRPCASPAERSDIEEITRAYVNLGETLDWAGRIEEAARSRGRGQRSARSSRASARWPPCWPATRRLRLLRLGRWDEADAALAIALDAAISGVTAGAALAGRALLDALRGRFDEVAETPSMRPSARRRTPSGRCGRGRWPSRAAELALWRGRPGDARDAIVGHARPASIRPTRTPSISRPSSPSARGPPPTSPSRPAPPGTRRPSARPARSPTTLVERARHLVRPEAFPAGHCPPEALLNVAATAGRARARAPGSGAAAAWRDVAARWDAFGAPYAAAYARWRLAEAILADGGARADAQAALAAAHAVADGCAPARWPPSSRRSPAGRGSRWTAARAPAAVGRRRRRRRARRPHRARARGPAPRGRGRDQPLDRPGPLHQREDRQRPHLADPGQARRPRPRRGGGPGPAPRPPDEETEAAPEG